MSDKLGYTPNRFRYEVIFPNNPLRPFRPPWEALTWDGVTVALRALIENAGDPVLEVRIIAIDPLGDPRD